MGDYLNPAYPASVDERAVDEWQMPSIFEYDQAHTTNPMVYLREGWYGIGSLSQVAFAGGQSITDQTSNLLVSNLEVTTVTGVTGVFSNTDVSTLTGVTGVFSNVSVSTVTGTTVISSNADVGTLAIAGTDITATATELNRYNDESGLIKNMSMANYTILDSDEYYFFKATTSTADITLALPTASDNSGRVAEIGLLASSGGNVTLSFESSENKTGVSEITGVGSIVKVISDGTSWHLSSAIGGCGETSDVERIGSFEFQFTTDNRLDYTSSIADATTVTVSELPSNTSQMYAWIGWQKNNQWGQISLQRNSTDTNKSFEDLVSIWGSGATDSKHRFVAYFPTDGNHFYVESISDTCSKFYILGFKVRL